MSRRSAAGRSDEPGRTEPTEIEVKLGVSLPRRVRALLRNPEPDRLAGFEPAGPLTVRTITDRYLDTDQDGGRLSTGSMRARLRHNRRRVVLTVKRTGVEAAAGVTERVELEAPATRDMDPDRWPPSDARTALLERVGTSKLGEVARLRQHRTIRVLRRGGTRVEVSLDRVEAMVGDRVVDRRYELEAELLAGDRAALEDLAGALGRIDGIGPAAGSKLAFGLAARAAAESPAPGDG